MATLPYAHVPNGYAQVRPSPADRDATQDASGSSVDLVECEVPQAGDAALTALEKEDRDIWAVLTEAEALFDETTPEMRKRANDLGMRWCEIIRDMTTTPADSFIGVQVKLRYLINELATDPYDEVIKLAESIGRDIERLTGEPLGVFRRD